MTTRRQLNQAIDAEEQSIREFEETIDRSKQNIDRMQALLDDLRVCGKCGSEDINYSDSEHGIQWCEDCGCIGFVFEMDDSVWWIDAHDYKDKDLDNEFPETANAALEDMAILMLNEAYLARSEMEQPNPHYPELIGDQNRGAWAPPPTFPGECPSCGAHATDRSERYETYACGGGYLLKPQIQNHTDYFWGKCGRKCASPKAWMGKEGAKFRDPDNS